jgi:hypothetical protein
MHSHSDALQCDGRFPKCGYCESRNAVCKYDIESPALAVLGMRKVKFQESPYIQNLQPLKRAKTVGAGLASMREGATQARGGVEEGARASSGPGERDEVVDLTGLEDVSYLSVGS